MSIRPRTDPVPLRAVIAAVPDAVVTGDPAGTVSGVTHDSREVIAGDLYAAMPGASHHGADFANEAVAAGASAILTDEEGAARITAAVPVVVADSPRNVLGQVSSEIYGRPSEKLTVLGVTGTNGKTTTSYLLDAGLRGAGMVTGLLGTIETRVGDRALPSVRTTPEAPDLQASLALMLEAGAEAVSMEVSSHALALRRIDGTRLRASIFTNLTQDHLDFHPSLEDYFKAKARLFTEALTDVAVINVDDPYGLRLLERSRLPVVTFSVIGSHLADWTLASSERDGMRSRLALAGPTGERLQLSVALLGGFNASNLLGAVSALSTLGLDLDKVVQGIEALPGVPGRMEVVDAGQPFVALVDYAHTPDAVATLLSTLRELTPSRVIIVLGCGGDRDASKRPLMGRAAASAADVAVLTSDNPRSEDPSAILAEMEEGARAAGSPHEIHIELDRRAAIELAVSLARPGDVVCIAGKGHETGQDIGGVVHHFDDREVLRQALAAR